MPSVFNIMAEQKLWYVYKHVSPSGKVYIGITSQNPEIRWNKGKNYKLCKCFYRAILKYGWDNIKHEIILSNICKSHAIYTEKYLISWYKIHGISYNITDGGEGTLGIVFSEESKRKISIANKGRVSPNKGKCLSESTRLKISNSRKGKYTGKDNPNYNNGDKIRGEKHPMWGKHHSKETIEKIRSKNTGRKIVATHKMLEHLSQVRNKRSILQYDLNDLFIREFESVIEAARYYNKGKSTASHIIECCRGKRNKVLNYKWKYKDG